MMNKKPFFRFFPFLILVIILIILHTTMMSMLLFSSSSTSRGPFTKSLIPKDIWQTAKSHDAPRAAQRIMNTWDRKNPDWSRHLLDDNELLDFMSLHFNQTVVEAFQKLPLPVMRADFFRLAVMYYEGGVYADVDVECKMKISRWSDQSIDKCSVLIGMENHLHLCNWGFASVKNHTLFRTAVELSLSRFLHQSNLMQEMSRKNFVHRTTGPGLLTDAVRNLVKANSSCFSTSKEYHGRASFNLWNNCRDFLREKHNVCLFDKATQETWFKNYYSSQKSYLQSENWLSSWTEERDRLFNNEEDGNKPNNNNHPLSELFMEFVDRYITGWF